MEKEKLFTITVIFFKETFKTDKGMGLGHIYSTTFISIKEIGFKIVLTEKESFLETDNYFLRETFKMD
jgi:hypothetical protein